MDSVMPTRLDAHIRKEIDGLSIDEVTFTGGSFVNGEVVGKNNAGVYTKLDLTEGATESHEAAGVVYGNYDATDADVVGLAHVRLTAVEGDYLVHSSVPTSDQQAAIVAQLAALHIVVR